MEHTATTRRIHPLVAAAAVSVTVLSLTGVAAITGLLPGTNGATDASKAASSEAMNAPLAGQTAQTSTLAPAAVAATAPEPAPAPAPVAKQVVQHKTIVHHEYPRANSAERPPVAQAEPAQQPAAAPQPAPAAQNSALGIGIGAVVGGLVGNQVGGGSGKKLATIAGVIGGGYVGNEIAKRNQQPQEAADK